MTYSSDLYDDDRPYFMKTNEKGDKILQIPQQWANFDLPYFAFNYRPAFPLRTGPCGKLQQRAFQLER